MKKLSLLCVLSAGCLFAGDNLILNGGFDGTATQSGWGGYASSEGFSCPNWTFEPAARAGLGKPEGTWFASGLAIGTFGLFIQSNGQVVTVNQTLASVPAGWYRFSVKYTGRPGHIGCSTQIYLGDALVGTVTAAGTALYSFSKDLEYRGGENVVLKFFQPSVSGDKSNCFDDAQLRRLDASIGDAHFLDFATAMDNARLDDVITYTTAGNNAVLSTGTYSWNHYLPKVVVPGTCVVDGTVTIKAEVHGAGTITLIEAGAFDIRDGGGFVLDPSLADNCSLAVVGNQLQLTCGSQDRPAWAEWDIGNANWRYFFSDGSPFVGGWDEGITDQIEVHFSSLEEFNEIKTLDVTPSRFVLAKLNLPSGAGLYDFTGGVAFDVAQNAVIDLKGNRLKLPAANIGGSVPFTVTDSGVATSLIANGSFESYNGTIGNGGAWNYASGGFSFKDWTTSTSAGITRGITTWVDASVPNGSYACYMQGNAEVKQIITTTEDGPYTVNFRYVSRRWHPAGNLNFSVDGEEKMVLTGISTWTPFLSKSVSFMVPPGQHEIRFGGQAIGGDVATIIDDVKLTRSGCLIFEVPEGETLVNNNVAISGLAGVVKEGAGTFLANRSQSYTGGTKITGGLVKIAGASSLGASGDVIIGADATFEINGVGGLNNFNFTLEGGVLQNTGSDIGSGYAQMSRLRLTADSTFKLSGSYGFIGGGYSATRLDLGGHTLTVPIGADKRFWLYNATVTSGTVDLAGGWLAVDKTAVNAPDATFRVNCPLDVAVPFTVGTYEANYGSDNNAGTGVMTVKQTFKPTTAFFRGVTVAKGALLDLTKFRRTLPKESSFSAGKTPMVYPTGTDETLATLWIDLHQRVLTSPKILDWDAIPENLTVLPTEPTKREGRSLYMVDDGVYVTGGTLITFR